MNLILASGSPRRKELLERVGYKFTVKTADIDETLQPCLSPREQVLRLSRLKAEAVYRSLSGRRDTVVLAADTVVLLEDKILGKPDTPAAAAEMLLALSGRSHLVLTGITVLGPEGMESHCEGTEVWFRPLSGREIGAYVATGEPMDKAGAYGIQGRAALFIRRLSGDYYNVVGLPLCAASEMLRRAGIPILEAQT